MIAAAEAQAIARATEAGADPATITAVEVEDMPLAYLPGNALRVSDCRTSLRRNLGGSPDERAKLVRELVEKIIVDEKTIIIKLQRGALLGGAFDPHSAAPSLHRNFFPRNKVLLTAQKMRQTRHCLFAPERIAQRSSWKLRSFP